MDANQSQTQSTGRFDTSAPVDQGTPPSPAAGLRDIPQQFAALKEYAAYYVAAKIDSIKVTARNIGVYAGLGIIGLLAIGTVISTAVVLLLVGASIGISRIFGPDREWIGALIVGILVLGGLAAGVIFGLRWLTNTSRASLVKKYENRQREQRVNLGRDVRGREADDDE